MYYNEWIYDIESKMCKVLHKAGFALFYSGDNCEWFKREVDPTIISPRFTSPQQATSYAYQKLTRGQLS